MAEQNYIASIKDLLEDLRQITIIAMAQAGVKEDSDLSKSVKFYLTKDGIQMRVAEYYPFVSEGHLVKRRAGLRKVPLDALIKWIKAKGILPRSKKTGRFVTINQMAFAVQMSIWKKGISGKIKTKGKKYADTVANDVADYTATKLADVLAEAIADDLVNMFEPVSV